MGTPKKRVRSTESVETPTKRARPKGHSISNQEPPAPRVVNMLRNAIGDYSLTIEAAQQTLGRNSYDHNRAIAYLQRTRGTAENSDTESVAPNGTAGYTDTESFALDETPRLRLRPNQRCDSLHARVPSQLYSMYERRGPLHTKMSSVQSPSTLASPEAGEEASASPLVPHTHEYITEYTFQHEIPTTRYYDGQPPNGTRATKNKNKKAWLCNRKGGHAFRTYINGADQKTYAGCSIERGLVKARLDFEVEATSTNKRDQRAGPYLVDVDQQSGENTGQKKFRPTKYDNNAATELYHQLMAAGHGHAEAMKHCRTPFSWKKKFQRTGAWEKQTQTMKKPRERIQVDRQSQDQDSGDDS